MGTNADEFEKLLLFTEVNSKIIEVDRQVLTDQIVILMYQIFGPLSLHADLFKTIKGSRDGLQPSGNSAVAFRSHTLK